MNTMAAVIVSSSSPRRACVSRQAGLSLLGVLVSLLLLLAGVVVLSRLMARTEKTVGDSTERFVALNLAREGIELVQAQRDTNWFNDTVGVLWTDRLCSESATSSSFLIDVDEAIGIYIDNDISGDRARLRVRSDGLWTHIVDGTEPTPYSRMMTVDCEQQGGDPALIAVTGTVTWESRGKIRDVVISTKLYDWY